MIFQIFKVANKSYKVVQYKQENLILNTIANKTVNANIKYKK